MTGKWKLKISWFCESKEINRDEKKSYLNTETWDHRVHIKHIKYSKWGDSRIRQIKISPTNQQQKSLIEADMENDPKLVLK